VAAVWLSKASAASCWV